MRGVVGAALLVAAVLVPEVGSAQTEPARTEPTRTEPTQTDSTHGDVPPAPGCDGPRTDRCCYDGREPPERYDELLWVARAVLVPLWLAVHAGGRATEATLSGIEGVPSAGELADTSRPWNLAPILQLAHERSPAAGIYGAARVGPAYGRLWFRHWDDTVIEGRLNAAIQLGPVVAVRLDARAGRRRDAIFDGLGWDASPSDRLRFALTRAEARLDVAVADGKPRLELALGTAHRHRVAELERPGATAQPPNGRATVLQAHGVARIDTREATVRAPRPGFALEVETALVGDFDSASRWLAARADAIAALAVGPEHELALGAHVALLEPFGDDAVPFVEKLALGDAPGRLLGFQAGALRGDAAAVLHARYRWGLHPVVDAALHVEVGNVFAAGFEDFDVGRTRLSFGASIDGAADDHHRVGVAIALGTDPFVSGASPTSAQVRLWIGAAPGTW